MPGDGNIQHKPYPALDSAASRALPKNILSSDTPPNWFLQLQGGYMSTLDRTHSIAADHITCSNAERIFDETVFHQSHKEEHQIGSALLAASQKLTDIGLLPALALDHNGYEFKSDGTKIKYDVAHDNDSERVTEVDYGDGTSRKFAYEPDAQDSKRRHVYKIEDRDGTTWLQDEDGVFQHVDRCSNNLGCRDASASVGRDGTFRFTDTKDKSSELFFIDGSSLNYDENGNATKFQYADGRTREFSYNKGAISDVKDDDGTHWKPDAQGLFHQYDEQGEETGRTANGGKFMPPTTETNLYGNDHLSGLRNGLLMMVGKIVADGLSPKDISTDDIKQGNLGDCYFLSAVASVCEQEPEKIKEMIKQDPNNYGGYIVTFPGRPDQPITIEAPTQDELDRFARNVNGTWVCVLEKAHRQMASDLNLDNDALGLPSRALSLLTGKDFSMHYFCGDTILGYLSEVSPVPDFDHIKVLEDQLTTAFENHQEICAGTNSNTHLVPSHEYTVMGYDPATQTVKLRNPWGRNDKFEGFKTAKECDPAHPGEFTMSIQEFYENFSDIATQTA